MKLKKITTEGSSVTSTEYAGNFVYENGILQFFSTAEGYAEPTTAGGFAYVYQYKDHLGNIRLSYADSNGDGLIAQTEIREEDNYYPFGLKHKGYNNVVTSTNPAQKYKYNGKEFQDELDLNMYDYGWRNYDPAIARWVNSDPLLNDLDFSFDDSDVDEDDEEEVYEALITKLETGGGIYNANNLNPYGYGYNNPVSFDDPDGRCPWCIAGLKGALFEYGSQVIGNLAEGKDLGDALTDVDGGEILKAGVTDALTLGVGGFIKKGTKVVGLANKADNANDARKNVQKAEKVINGNSKLSTKAQVNYRVTNTKTGKSKTGISGGKVDKKGNPYRANKQANAWNKKDGEGTWKVEVGSKTKAGSGARTKALKKEVKDAKKLKKEGKLDTDKHKKPQ